METIRLTTWINAPFERCFLLATSIDLHIASAAGSGEEAVEGVKTGLIRRGEMVTWQGRHLGMKLRHRSRIDGWRPHYYFRDVMVDGIFKHYKHDHFFAAMDDGTRMRDEIHFTAPIGFIGQIATKLIVRRHLTEMLVKRNAMIKRVAETEEWHKYLDGHQTSTRTMIKPEDHGGFGSVGGLTKGVTARA